MRLVRSFPLVFAAGIFLFCFFPSIARAFDHSAWDAFLKKHVDEKGNVDYGAVTQDPKSLQDYLASLSAVTGMEMNGWPREERIAFWLNAYHAMMIKLVTEHYPVTSVQRIPSFWDIAVIRIKEIPSKEIPLTAKAAGGKQHSLNQIRTEELIEIFRDEKIHFALSMAARGGPRLIAEAFTGPKVEGQLFQLTQQFVNDPFFVDVVPGRKKIRISKIFKWYGKDFKLDFGTPEPFGKFSAIETSVLSFLAYYLEDENKSEFLQEGRYKIEYPTFDWTLNDRKASAG